MHTEQIRNPSAHQVISQNQIQISINSIQSAQKEQNYAKYKNEVFIPGKALATDKLRYVTQSATNSERYKTKVSTWTASALEHHKYPMMVSGIGISLFQRILPLAEKLPKSKNLTEAQYIDNALYQRIEASCFDPRSFYGVLSYVQSNTGCFEKLPTLETFYDPCGGLGRTIFSCCSVKG